MKIVIGKYRISLNEETMRRMKREAYVKKMKKILSWTGIDSEILESRLVECFNMVTGAVD